MCRSWGLCENRQDDSDAGMPGSPDVFRAIEQERSASALAYAWQKHERGKG